MDGAKRADRARMRAVVRGATAERRVAAGRALAEALISHPRWHAWRCMLGFAATAREPATAPALAAAYANGLVVGLPRVAGKLLHYHRVEPRGASAERLPTGLRRGYRGVAEPAPDAPRLDFDRLPAEVAVLVPGAAFDRTGGRLGWGGGHYDRTLAALSRSRGSAVLIGVCFSDQLLDFVPRAGHDLPVDLVVTEREVVSARHGPQRGRRPGRPGP
ncbi:MAG: 5-formyltetrahydrofolate cyclo-ligase [Spirochaetaceae bacterium]|nr:5-formyltetrahydrofolate cyclo-ligase [Spirochaetaceae bacterium]